MLGLLAPRRGELMLVDGVQTSHPLRYVVELHTWRPLWAGAAGLGVLAFLEEGERARLLREHPPQRVTDQTLSTAGAVEEFCALMCDIDQFRYEGLPISASGWRAKRFKKD